MRRGWRMRRGISGLDRVGLYVYVYVVFVWLSERIHGRDLCLAMLGGVCSYYCSVLDEWIRGVTLYLVYSSTAHATNASQTSHRSQPCHFAASCCRRSQASREKSKQSSHDLLSQCKASSGQQEVRRTCQSSSQSNQHRSSQCRAPDPATHECNHMKNGNMLDTTLPWPRTSQRTRAT